ncbi:MAG: hypothetical protein ABGY95_11740 [Rubritalea sp.]|mgnify:CR=1 FL=1|uniref:hypothetical protein n=1 Tax=Rubritalea sp. TaxID=2109375 RepID=UPI0032429BCB
MFNMIFSLGTSLALGGLTLAHGPRPEQLGPIAQPVGEQGVLWYTTWQTGFEEAQRSNRPIFFFAAAAQCGTVSGTF